MKEIEKLHSKPEFLILQDGTKIDLKKCDFVLVWDIGKENVVTYNVSVTQEQNASAMLHHILKDMEDKKEK